MENIKNALDQIGLGDYILIVTKAKISFAGRFVGNNKIENFEVLSLRPDEGGELWISVSKDYLEKVYLLEKEKERNLY